jgi:hypothetical protein
MNKKATRKSKVPTNQALGLTMCNAIGAYLDHNGWSIGTVGPCEIRVNDYGADKTGKTLAVYEFVTKFYGMRKSADPCGAAVSR